MRGETAALGTALCWACSSLLFSAAARRHGAPQLNLLRLLGATLLLALAVAAAGGPGTLPAGQLLALGLSGVVGLALGDAAFFRSLRILGPRRAMLLMALAPVGTALLMVPLLGEALRWPGLAGMALTIGGVVWVQTERDDGTEVQGEVGHGIVFGLLGALGQAGGYVLAKVGLGAAPEGALLSRLLGAEGQVAVGALPGTLVRMVAGSAALLALLLAGRGPPRLGAALRDGRFLALAGGGTLLGPVLGVWLSLVAVAATNTAVASTIVASSPVFVIPLTRVVHGHRATWRAWVGALVALAGIAVLSARGELPG